MDMSVLLPPSAFGPDQQDTCTSPAYGFAHIPTRNVTDVSTLKPVLGDADTASTVLHSAEVHRLLTLHEDEKRQLQTKFELQSQRRQQQHQESLKQRDDTIAELKSELSRLKSYYQHEVPAASAVNPIRWSEEKVMLERELEKSQKNLALLQTSYESLTTRQTAMSRIVSLQEQQVVKSSKVDSKPSGNARSDLLTLWREKVYALLIQLQLQETAASHEKAKASKQIRELTAQMEQSSAENDLLSSRLLERQAACQQTEQTVNELQQEVVTCQSTIDKLREVCTSRDEELVKCSQDVERFSAVHASFKEKHLTCLERLQALEWRIEFATKRVAMSRDLKQIKPVSRSTTEKEANADLSAAVPEAGKLSNLSSGDRLSLVEQLQIELATVCKERDQLATQLRLKSEEYDDNLRSAVEKATLVENTLEGQLQSTTVQLSDLWQAHQAAAADLVDANSQIKQLTDALGNVERIRGNEIQLGQKLQNCLRKNEQLEATLGEVQKEHAKCAVRFQNARRELARQRETMTAQARLQQQQLADQIEQLEKRLQETEKERNLYITTLRQDGHLKNLREMRRPPLASALLQRPVTGTPSSLYGWQSKAAKDKNGLEEFGNSLDREVVAVDSKSAESDVTILSTMAQSLEQLRQLSLAVLSEDTL